MNGIPTSGQDKKIRCFRDPGWRKKSHPAGRKKIFFGYFHFLNFLLTRFSGLRLAYIYDTSSFLRLRFVYINLQVCHKSCQLDAIKKQQQETTRQRTSWFRFLGITFFLFFSFLFPDSLLLHASLIGMTSATSTQTKRSFENV